MRGIANVLAPLNADGTRATILRWCKAVGETVVKDEPLLELETDKVTVEVPAPADGTLIEILKQPNAEVTPDEVLARLSLASESAPAAPSPPSPPGAATAAGTAASPASTSRGRRAGAGDASSLLSPSVRQLLREHSLDASAIDGTG